MSQVSQRRIIILGGIVILGLALALWSSRNAAPPAERRSTGVESLLSDQESRDLYYKARQQAEAWEKEGRKIREGDREWQERQTNFPKAGPEN